MANETKWTPGPWVAGAGHVQTDNGVMRVVARTHSGCDVERAEARANARLIAQAPAMAETLKALREAIADVRNDGERQLLLRGTAMRIDEILAAIEGK